MDRYQSWRHAYEFLRTRGPGASFTSGELEAATGWKPATAQTYLNKRLRGITRSLSADLHQVLPEIERMSLDRFIAHSTQVRRIYSKYEKSEYSSIVTYEFLLPLTRETELRAALNSLFYSDTLERRLNEIGLEGIREWFPAKPGENDSAYVGRILSRVDGWFGGYSISHVSGRFRAGALQTRADAAKVIQTDREYLIDETTAMVRFIVPLGTSETIDLGHPVQKTFFDLSEHDEPISIDNEMKYVQQFFFDLFVEAIVRTIDGEDEIWLIEQSPIGRSLHVWRKQPV